MKTLKARKDLLSSVEFQLEMIEKPLYNGKAAIMPFKEKLLSNGLYPLQATEPEILQVNLGKMCNQTCAHCHVDAGPNRKEIMTRESMKHCLVAIDTSPSIHTVDLTGGAPEMNPEFVWFTEEISKRNVKLIIRSNLTILISNKKYQCYPDFFAKHNIKVIASLPCYTAENTDKQRGNGVFEKSLIALKMLNDVGYGKEGTALELHLVYNPVGPSLPPQQEKLEADYKKILLEDFGIVFNKLYTITNLPINRFLEFLLSTGKYEDYMEKLVNAFNPRTVDGLMCRNTISVSWNGQLYDCDFNQMLELPTANEAPKNIATFHSSGLKGRNIQVNQHCYGCAAGAGSSCQGTIV